jgi:hypothetical protein
MIDQKNIFRIILRFFILVISKTESAPLEKKQVLSSTQKVISILKAENKCTCEIYIMWLHKLN